MLNGYELLFKEIETERMSLKHQWDNIDEIIESDVEGFARGMLAKDFSDERALQAKTIYREQLKKRILSEIELRMEDLAKLESKLKGEMRYNLKKFTRKGLSFIFSSL